MAVETNLTEVTLLLGGNLGDVAYLLSQARIALSERVGEIIKVSKLYRSEAWGFSAESEFVNQAVVVATSLSAEEFLDQTQAIEQSLGRDRVAEQIVKSEKCEKYSSRTMDIDIIFWGESVILTPRLSVPHPLMADRRFVLEPLSEIIPHVCHPLTGRSVVEMLNDLEIS